MQRATDRTWHCIVLMISQLLYGSLNLHVLGLFHVTPSDAVQWSQCSTFWFALAAVGLSDKFIKLSTKWASTALMSFSLLDNGWKIIQKVRSTLIFLVKKNLTPV